VRLTDAWLEAPGGVASDAAFPDADQYELFRSNDHLVSGADDTITVITKDRPGVFARVAGALALSDLNIIGGQTHVEDGKVLEVVTVVDADDEETPVDWTTVTALVEEILATTDDLAPRFEARAGALIGRRVVAPSPIESVRVDFDNDISATATVIEVAGPDRLGLLYELSTALAEAGLDQTQTRVQTVGGDVVDSFYVQTLEGNKFVDPQQQADLKSTLLAILEPAT